MRGWAEFTLPHGGSGRSWGAVRQARGLQLPRITAPVKPIAFTLGRSRQTPDLRRVMHSAQCTSQVEGRTSLQGAPGTAYMLLRPRCLGRSVAALREEDALHQRRPQPPSICRPCAPRCPRGATGAPRPQPRRP